MQVRSFQVEVVHVPVLDWLQLNDLARYQVDDRGPSVRFGVHLHRTWASCDLAVEGWEATCMLSQKPSLMCVILDVDGVLHPIVVQPGKLLVVLDGPIIECVRCILILDVEQGLPVVQLCGEALQLVLSQGLNLALVSP